MTTATAPGAARGRACEGASRREELEETMTKSISRSQVRLIASTNAIFGADEACAMLRISRDAMYRLAPPALTVRACYKVIGGPLSYF